eukprot:COSAG01_NODE_2296_length_7966_cov_270.955765_4_plen_256_part_00
MVACGIRGLRRATKALAAAPPPPPAPSWPAARCRALPRCRGARHASSRLRRSAACRSRLPLLPPEFARTRPNPPLEIASARLPPATASLLMMRGSAGGAGAHRSHSAPDKPPKTCGASSGCASAAAGGIYDLLHPPPAGRCHGGCGGGGRGWWWFWRRRHPRRAAAPPPRSPPPHTAVLRARAPYPAAAEAPSPLQRTLCHHYQPVAPVAPRIPTPALPANPPATITHRTHLDRSPLVAPKCVNRRWRPPAPPPS